MQEDFGIAQGNKSGEKKPIDVVKECIEAGHLDMAVLRAKIYVQDMDDTKALDFMAKVGEAITAKLIAQVRKDRKLELKPTDNREYRH